MIRKANYGYAANGSSLRTQSEVIKNWMLTHLGRAISQKECTDMFGFTRLSALIYILKNEYHLPIRSERRDCPNRFGGISTPMFYWLNKEDVECCNCQTRK